MFRSVNTMPSVDFSIIQPQAKRCSPHGLLFLETLKYYGHIDLAFMKVFLLIRNCNIRLKDGLPHNTLMPLASVFFLQKLSFFSHVTLHIDLVYQSKIFRQILLHLQSNQLGPQKNVGYHRS